MTQETTIPEQFEVPALTLEEIENQDSEARAEYFIKQQNADMEARARHLELKPENGMAKARLAQIHAESRLAANEEAARLEADLKSGRIPLTNELDVTKTPVAAPAPVAPAAPETVLEVDPREVPFMLDIALRERDEANSRGTALKARIAFYENYIQNTVRVLKNNDIDLNELIRADAEKAAAPSTGPIV